MNKYKIIVCSFAAIIASVGTIPYGYFFAGFLAAYHPDFSLLAGILFAATAAIANAALGLYSLLNFKLQQESISISYLLLISLISAISAGCMNFFAYTKILPLMLNCIMTAAVILTNAAIASVALSNTIINLRQHGTDYISRLHSFMKWSGFLIGVLASLTAYVAAAHGISQLLAHYLRSEIADYLAFGISIIIWLPSAALFGNSVQLCLETFFFWAQEFQKNIHLIQAKQILILLFALLSSFSFTQIAVTFFDIKMNIPHLLKINNIQFFIHKILIPLCMLSSFFVNYLALIRIERAWKDAHFF